MPRAAPDRPHGTDDRAAPEVALGSSGKFNHMVGVHAAATVLAVNHDPDALVFDNADIGIMGDAVEAAALLAGELERLPVPR